MNVINNIFSINQSYNSFKIFHFTHLVLILISFITTIYVIKLKKKNKLFILVSCIVLISSQVCYYCWYLFTQNNFLQNALPLYHCDIAIILIIIGTIFRKNNLIKIGTYWGLFGSVFGILFPTCFYFKFPFPHITHLYHFSCHIFLLLMSTYYLFVNNLGMTKYDYRKSIIFTICYDIFIFNFNLIFSSNYAFVNKLPFDICIEVSPIASLFLVSLLFMLIISLEYKLINFIYKKFEI